MHLTVVEPLSEILRVFQFYQEGSKYTATSFVFCLELLLLTINVCMSAVALAQHSMWLCHDLGSFWKRPRISDSSTSTARSTLWCWHHIVIELKSTNTLLWKCRSRNETTMAVFVTIANQIMRLTPSTSEYVQNRRFRAFLR